MIKFAKITFFILVVSLTDTSSQPIRLHPANPHYFLYKGQPTILITSAEHYGAVLNLDFNYTRYLNALSDGGVNYTRIYTGAYFEPENRVFKNSSLAPTNDALCLPWRRSSIPGYVLGGNKFDLDKWNPDYFKRLKGFISYAGSKGIIVEVCLYNCQKSDTWPIHPLNINCNVNNIGQGTFAEFQTLKEPALVEYQKKYVQKIVRAVNEFDNVIIEIIDEPTIRNTSGSDASAWISSMTDVVINTERSFPKKHLIGQQVEGGSTQGPVDLSSDPRISVIIGQYVWQNRNQVGALKLLDTKYKYNKVIEFNETQIYTMGYKKGDPLAASRVEAWEFIVGGGGSYNQLNGLFTVVNEDAAGTGNDSILMQLKVLRDFMYSFDFIKMQRDTSFIVEGENQNLHVRGISEPNSQYAFYLHHSRNPTGNPSLFLYYEALPGEFKDTITLNVQPGIYFAKWINPSTGEVIFDAVLSHSGGSLSFISPEYKTDIALKITKNDSLGDINAPLIRSNNLAGAIPSDLPNDVVN